MQENVCFAETEAVLALSSFRVPFFLLSNSVTNLINLEFKLSIMIDSVQF